MDLDPGGESMFMSKNLVLRGAYSLSISPRVDVSPRLAKQAGLAFLRLGTCQTGLWRNTTGSSFQMPTVSAENVSLMTDDLLTPCKSQIRFGIEGKGGERLVQRPVPIKNVTLPVVNRPPKSREQGPGGAVLPE
ncbi:hypothetical protein BTVI_88009 [Pitangus sulphuratus]|nr:hypothetical protein BTVI_88009 [Pitangus sulphuratus]